MVRPIPGRPTFKQIARRELRGWAARTLGDMAQASVIQLVQQAAVKYGLDPGLVVAQARLESGFNPSAVNPKSGAKGVMQLLDSTAAQFGVTNLFDPVANVDAGVHYLAQLLRSYGGDIGKALAAYDWGPGNLNKAIQAWGDDWLNHAPAETQNYLATIAGIHPSVTPASSPDTPPLTIDAATGQVIEDSTPTPGDIVPAGVAPGTSPNYLLLTALGIGAYLLADSLFRD